MIQNTTSPSSSNGSLSVRGNQLFYGGEPQTLTGMSNLEALLRMPKHNALVQDVPEWQYWDYPKYVHAVGQTPGNYVRQIANPEAPGITEQFVRDMQNQNRIVELSLWPELYGQKYGPEVYQDIINRTVQFPNVFYDVHNEFAGGQQGLVQQAGELAKYIKGKGGITAGGAWTGRGQPVAEDFLNQYGDYTDIITAHRPYDPSIISQLSQQYNKPVIRSEFHTRDPEMTGERVRNIMGETLKAGGQGFQFYPFIDVWKGRRGEPWRKSLNEYGNLIRGFQGNGGKTMPQQKATDRYDPNTGEIIPTDGALIDPDEFPGPIPPNPPSFVQPRNQDWQNMTVPNYYAPEYGSPAGQYLSRFGWTGQVGVNPLEQAGIQTVMGMSQDPLALQTLGPAQGFYGDVLGGQFAPQGEQFRQDVYEATRSGALENLEEQQEKMAREFAQFGGYFGGPHAVAQGEMAADTMSNLAQTLANLNLQGYQQDIASRFQGAQGLQQMAPTQMNIQQQLLSNLLTGGNLLTQRDLLNRAQYQQAMGRGYQDWQRAQQQRMMGSNILAQMLGYQPFQNIVEKPAPSPWGSILGNLLGAGGNVLSAGIGQGWFG